jgi:hypothetical protein
MVDVLLMQALMTAVPDKADGEAWSVQPRNDSHNLPQVILLFQCT